MNEQSVFIAALEREPADRARFLDQACENHPGLRQRVERLIASHEAAVSFMGEPAGQLVNTVDQPPLETAGAQVGPYKLLQEVGQGGMGVVYMAEQVEPVRRKVALKIIKPGMDTRQVIARFEAERQALSLMDHPNIAKVLDAGTTGTGRPYFVMELVKGQPITEYCDQQHLTPRQRLELLLPVCQAIQHAHQKGVIHRDIKPSNILVAEYDQQAVPKVIDFGVAKAVSQPLTEKTMFTGIGQIVGTLEYMSPEQAKVNQLDIDTRSDIYSLGVLLYELLTASTPIDKQRLRSAAWDEMLRIIREEEPPKPSTRLSDSKDSLPTISAQRHTEPAKLTKLVRGELDWIVMKALEKDRNRRYETANGFASDIQRYLNDEPVAACPPSAAYRLRKFARRNKRALVTAAALLIAFVAVAGTVGWAVRDREARHQEAERTRTLREAAVKTEVNLALQEADRFQQQADWLMALSAAKRAQGLLANSGSDELRQRVSQYREDLDLVLRLEDFRVEREQHFDHGTRDEAYARLFAEFGIEVRNSSAADVAARIARRPATAVRVAAALDDWALVLRDWGTFDPDRDATEWRRLLEIARRADPDPWRGKLRQLMGQEDVIELRKLADESNLVALPIQSLQQMGCALAFARDHRACVDWLRKAHSQHPGDPLLSFDLAFHLNEAASPDHAEVLRFAEAALAARPNRSMYAYIGLILTQAKKHDAAIDYCRRAIDLDPSYASAYDNLGVALQSQGKIPEAIVAYRKSVELNTRFSLAWAHLASALAVQGELDEADVCCHKSIEFSPQWAWAHTNLGNLMMLQGKRDEALAAWCAGIELDPKSAVSLASTLAAQKNLDEAIVVLRKAIEVDPQNADTRNWLVWAYSTRGQWDNVAATYQGAIELDPQLAVANKAEAYFHRATAYAALGQWKNAVADFDQSLELEPKAHEAWRQAAYARMAAGDAEGYRQACRELLERFGQTDDPIVAERTAKVCSLVPGTVADYGTVEKQAQRAVTGTEKHWAYRPFLMTKGNTECRAGRYESAAQLLTRSANANGGDCDAIAFAALAIAQHRLGRIEEATSALTKAKKIVMDKMPDPAKGRPFVGNWTDWVHADMLMREADLMLASDAPAAK